jgi:hypothetical protein
MARPKKIPKFDYDKPVATVHMGNEKYLAQGNDLFSYGEPKGKWVEGKGREYPETPVFIMTKKDWDLQQKKKEHARLKIETFAKSTALSAMEKELKAEGVIEDTS